MAVRGKCFKCGDQEFRVESDNAFRLGVPWLLSFFQREVEYACTSCGEVRQWSPTLFNLGNGQPSISLRPPSDDDVVEHKHALISNHPSGKDLMSIQYPAVFRDTEYVLLPISEGNVQDATSVDRYGEPDLMGRLRGRIPQTVLCHHAQRSIAREPEGNHAGVASLGYCGRVDTKGLPHTFGEVFWTWTFLGGSLLVGLIQPTVKRSNDALPILRLVRRCWC